MKKEAACHRRSINRKKSHCFILEVISEVKKKKKANLKGFGLLITV